METLTSPGPADAPAVSVPTDPQVRIEGETPGLDPGVEETRPPKADVGKFEDQHLETRAPATIGDRAGDIDWVPASESRRFPMVPGYEIRRELGRGGMGVVYLALQTRADRLVALKRIRGDAFVHPEQVERFRVEGQAVARLRHPNVVQIFDVGEVDGVPYFSLELLEGGTLKERLAAAPMSPRPAAELLVALAGAVDAAHRSGIVHRDIKPSNVIFDADGRPKVADFGLAKRLEATDDPTLTGQVVGTPSYMAPEQARGDNRAVGPPADIYALGALLYETLTGRPPFKGATISDTLQMVISQDPVAPSRLQPKLPRDLETVCLKCLAKEPAHRYATAAELADDLGRYLCGATIRARRTPAWERAAKWARRRPAAASAAALGLVAIVGIVAAVAWHDAEARRRLRIEDERIARARLEAIDAIDRGREQRSRGGLAEARTTLMTLQVRLQAEPRLARLGDRAAVELRDVDRRLAEQAAFEADTRRFERFRRLRDEALFRDAQFTGPGLEDPQGRTRAEARAALAVYAPAGGGGPGSPGPGAATLLPGRRAEVESGQYLLLMVLSEAVARPLPGEDPRRQAEEALRLLDRAARLRDPTPAYHLRRAACLERLGDTAAVRLEQGRADRLKPVEAFDHLLLGQERSRRGDWDAARSCFEDALRRPPDLFWAHCLLAIAELNVSPPRAAEARVELTTCLLQQPSYAWLYLLRGFACGTMSEALAAASAARLPAKPGRLAAEAEARAEDAEADFRKALELGLDDDLRYALLMARGTVRFQRRRLDDAVADFERAIALAPARHHGYASLAQALRKLGRRDEAIARLGEAIARAPALAALYRGRALARIERDGSPQAPDLEAALRDLEASSAHEARDGRHAAEDHALRGRILLRLRRPLDGLAAAEAALAIAPDLAEAHRVRALALLDLGRHDQLVEACDAALSRGDDAELHRLRGLGRVGRRDFAGAIDDFSRALATRPDWASAHSDRGWAFLLASSPGLARGDFDAAIRLAPSDPEGYAGRGLARVGLGLVREGIEDAEASLRYAGSSPRYFYSASRTYAEASSRAPLDVARRGRPPSRGPLARYDYESRAAGLLIRALELTPAAQRREFWDDVVARDATLQTLVRNPRIRERIGKFEGGPR